MKRSNNTNEIFKTVSRLDRGELVALTSLANGDANEAEQKIALDAIIYKLCRTYEDTFDTSSERMSSRMQGQRFVGLCIYESIKAQPLYISNLKEK